jgi:predicted nucleic acid-binding protein
LDSGESEAIALAIEVNAEAILIDEAAGRDIAAERGLTSLGTLGILVRAKRQGFLKEVRPLIEKLINELDFFVSEKLMQDVLLLAGE